MEGEEKDFQLHFKKTEKYYFRFDWSKPNSFQIIQNPFCVLI